MQEPFRVISSKAYRPAFAVLVCILFGNLGYYFFRAQWVIAQPAFKDENLMDNSGYITLMSLTYTVNILGKIIGGWLIDYSNRPTFVFVFFIILAALSTAVATMWSTIVSLMIFWPLCRGFTTVGKMAVIKLLANYWPSAVMGTVIGISTVSCNFGEAISKALLSLCLGLFKDDWKKVFYVAIGVGIACIVPCILFVRDGKPFFDPTNSSSSTTATHGFAIESIKEQYPASKDLDIKSEASTNASTTATVEEINYSAIFIQKLIKLLSNPRLMLLGFLMICISCLREILGAHSITYMKDVLGFGNSLNGAFTSIFCASSAIGTMIGGRLIDSIPKRHRSLVNVIYMAIVCACFSCVAFATTPNMTSFSLHDQRIWSVGFLLLSELFIGAPVSYVDGIYLVDLVDRSDLSFASGIVGCIGYIGPLVQNEFFKPWMREGSAEWHYVYYWGVTSAFIAACISTFYWIMDLKKARHESTTAKGDI